MQNIEFKIPKGMNLNNLVLDTTKEHQVKEGNRFLDSESRNVVKSPLQMAIEKNPLLKEILNRILPIDFEAKVYGDDVEFQKLRSDLCSARNPKEIKEINESLKKFEVKIPEKLVIVAEEICFHADTTETPCVVFENRFYLYNKQVWLEISSDIISEFLVQCAMKCGIPEYKIKQRRNREELYLQFIETQILPIKNELKTTEIKINLKNGTLAFCEGQAIIKPFCQDDFFRYQLPFVFDPQATCPRFDKFLDRVLPDKKCQDLLLEMLAYCYTSHKDLNLEKALLIYGSGSNGKSVLWNIVVELLGKENVSSYSLHSICSKENARAQLSGKLLNYSSELGGKFEPDVWKKLVSGEPVEARFLFKDIFLISGYGKFFFNTNTLPKDVEQNDAFFRRLIILPFNERITEHEMDIQLFDKLKVECSGIFNKTLVALDRLYKAQRFTQSDIADNELEQYRKSSNNVKIFVEDELWSKSQKNKMLLKNFYRNYTEYCNENGFRALNSRNFSARLRDLGYEIVQSTNNYTFVFCEKHTVSSTFSPKNI